MRKKLDLPPLGKAFRVRGQGVGMRDETKRMDLECCFVSNTQGVVNVRVEKDVSLTRSRPIYNFRKKRKKKSREKKKYFLKTLFSSIFSTCLKML